MLAHELIKELPSKRRTIHELISYVDTIKETSANYGVFLGAGASVSSGIRSAVELVDEWRKEQYFKLNPTPIGEYDVATAKEWLIREQSNWYDPKKEYSSLFERAFDLKPQRRVFVEREVAKGFPSLGYAYLVKLIEKEFFNTIFTTNFDDLINEAFHQFSEIRPIVCAHDSSILNVTFTSKRPKIVKLHGDYLFDDIKTTLRETEALEKNTRDKFIQLTKEIGLIIIGFAGNDRSIMDVLEFLLKDETYVKNGIYWCFRKNDYIGEDLKKLLWRDRIFWVEIEGFDQIFAEMYASLCGDVLPIDTNPINQHTTKIYNEYLDNNFLKNSECQVITAHLAQLKKEKNSNLIADLLKTITNEDISNEDTSNDNDSDDFENLQIFLKLQNLESERKYKEVIIFTNQHINSVTDTALREKLLLTSFTASRKINDDEQSLKTADL